LKWALCDLDFPKNITDKIAGPTGCATLQLPLEYTDLSLNNNTLNLQSVKQPATKEPVKITIVFNSGGPGESGMEVAMTGRVYRCEVFNE
jgi:hypothetical protein